MQINTLNLDNKNFLNNQNYIVTKTNKNIILNYYISLKYMGIILNKYIIFSVYTIFFFIINGFSLFNIYLYFIITPLYWTLLAVILLFFDINILNVKGFFKNFFKNFFEIKPLVFSYKSIYATNGRFNFMIIYIFYFIIGLFIIFNPFTINIVDNFFINTAVGIDLILFLIIFLSYFILIYLVAKRFYFKLNILNIFFYPLLMLFLFINYLLSSFNLSSYTHSVLKKHPINKLFNGFDNILNTYGDNSEYIVIKK